MSSKFGSTSKSDKDPKDLFHWVVCNGQVIASCVHPSNLVERAIPTKVMNFWSGAVVLQGRIPAIAVALNRRMSVIYLDNSMNVVRIRNLVGVRLAFPTGKRKVLVVTSEEILRKFDISVGDKFELKV